eukprot:16439998-Heterocapsa_arctica.AAC.1
MGEEEAEKEKEREGERQRERQRGRGRGTSMAAMTAALSFCLAASRRLVFTWGARVHTIVCLR